MKNGISRTVWRRVTRTLSGRFCSMAWMVLMFFGGALLETGCQVIPEPRPDPTRYYTLAIPEGDASLGKGSLRVGLRVVELAPHLKKGVMVVRKGEHELVYQDFARWAEPLEQSLTHALKVRLQASQKVGWVAVPPFPLEQERDYDVSVYVARCEGMAQGGASFARLTATIEIARPGVGSKTVVRKSFVAPDVVWDGRDYTNLAATLGGGAGLLAGEVEALLPTKN